MKKYKYLIIISILVFIISVGASYAYFAYQVENTVAIKGNIVSIDADLTVELVVGTNDEMVPMLDDALSNALNAVGTTNGACIDSQGNLSCQVYKITLANNGSRLKNLQGSIELYAKSGSTYTNLKWQELTDTTTIKEGTTPNGMSKSILVSGLTLESKESKSWYVAVWISETDSDQTDTDKGDFGGTVTFEVVDSNGLNEYGFYFGRVYTATMDGETESFIFYSDGSADSYFNGSIQEPAPAGTFSYGYKTIELDGDIAEVSENGKEIYFPGGNVILYLEEDVTISGNLASATPFIADVMVPNANSDKNIDFSKTSEESGTNGVYVVHSTIDDDYPIFYYRGAVEDNNLIFAGFCWKIVRTTESGGLKLIYNGTPTSGTCDNTGTNSQIGTSYFNKPSNSPTDVGYMYGNVYKSSSFNTSNMTEAYYFGNDVSYNEDTGKYTLTSTISNTRENLYNGVLDNYHYTCFSTSTTCDNENGEVYYIYHASNGVFYITLTEGKKIEDALEEMLDYNTTSSTIKGDKDTEGTLDNWYFTNIENTAYSSYIEDTVWCNDRSIYSLGGFDPNGGSTSESLYFSAQNRLSNGNPDLNCVDLEDRFTKETTNGNGALNYPVGLLTADEAMLAGDTYQTENTTIYLYTGNFYSTISPSYFGWDGDTNGLAGYFLHGGLVYLSNNLFPAGVRPSISLKSGFTIAEGGTGTTNNPYVVQ